MLVIGSTSSFAVRGGDTLLRSSLERVEADSEEHRCLQQQMASWSRSEAFADPDFIKPQVADATRVFQSCSQNFRPNFSFRKDDYRARQRWLNGNGRGKADRHCYMENGKR